MQIVCKNCETAYKETYKYCPECSQKSKLPRLTLHDVVHEGVHYFTHADKGLFQLIRDLVLMRGLVAYEYIEGKRKKYFPPLNFFFLIAAIFVFVATLAEPKVAVDVLKSHPEPGRIKGPVEQRNAIAIYERKANVAHFTTKYSNLMAMCSLPLTALVFWLFYIRAKYNYIEHLVAGMYMLGFCILIYAGIIMPLSFIFGFKGNPAILVFFIAQLLYFAVFYCGFLGKKTKLEFLKAFGVSHCSIVVWAMISGSLVRLYIASGFGGWLD